MSNSVTTIEPLPYYALPLIEIDELLGMIQQAKQTNCKVGSGGPLFTLFDIRTKKWLADTEKLYEIPTNCPTLSGLLDDLLDPQFRMKIPQDSPVYILSETGNRDSFVGRFLKKFGYTNVYGIKFGMRGWIKADYPLHHADTP